VTKLFLIISLFLSTAGFSQFTEIPVNTNEHIGHLAMDGDTLLILPIFDYFGKSYNMGQSVIDFTDPTPQGRPNVDLYVRQGVYYFLSIQQGPYFSIVMESKDRGQTWDTAHIAEGFFKHFNMYDTTAGLLCNDVYTSVVSLNPVTGGIWNQDTLTGFVSSAYYNRDTILLMDDGLANEGKISFNGGQTWAIRDQGHLGLVKTQFISRDTVYAAGSSGPNDDGVFKYSYDMWQNHSGVGISSSQINDFWFENSKHGYLFGAHYQTVNNVVTPGWYAAIYETSDFGATWKRYRLPYTGHVHSAVQANDSIFFLGCSNGLLLKWNRNIPIQTVGIDDIEFENSLLNIIPNPAQTEITINYPIEGEDLRVVIYDLSGHVVVNAAYINQTYNIEALEAGVYVVSLKSSLGILAQTKLVKY